MEDLCSRDAGQWTEPATCSQYFIFPLKVSPLPDASLSWSHTLKVCVSSIQGLVDPGRFLSWAPL